MTVGPGNGHGDTASRVWGRYAYPEADALAHVTGPSGGLSHHTFLLVRPDAIHRGQGEAILRRVRDAGFAVRLARLVSPTSRDLEELYRFTQARLVLAERRPYWWLMERYYTLGPALACLLHHPDPGAAERLDALKGPSNPWLGRPGELRHDFGAVNMCMCVVHTSTRTADVGREASVFFGRDELRCSTSASRDETLPALPVAAGSGRGFHELVLDLVCELGRLVGVDDLADAGRLPGPSVADGADRAAAFETELERAADRWQAASSAGVRGPVPYLLGGLVDRRTFAGADPVALAGVVEEIGIPLSAWDRLVLETTMPTYDMLRSGFVPADLEPAAARP